MPAVTPADVNNGPSRMKMLSGSTIAAGNAAKIAREFPMSCHAFAV
jgi:hypothetical protein